jgi:acyl carrier protein
MSNLIIFKKMVAKNEIVEIIFKCIDDINMQNGSEIKKDLNTKLFGSDSELDSIGLVNLITSIEENIEEITGKYIPFADERAFSLETSPFKTVSTLVNYVEDLVND